MENTQDSETLTAAKLLRERLDSRDWWIWPICTADATVSSTVNKFEQKFYIPAATALYDFAYVSFSKGMAAVAFAHKSRCSPKAMEKFLRKFGRVQAPGNKDIIICLPPGHDPVMYGALCHSLINEILADKTSMLLVTDPPEGTS